MESLVFIALTPLALILMGIVGLVSWHRRDVPGGWGLTAFTAMSAGWLVLDALALLAPTPGATVTLVQSTLVFAALLGVAWFGFVLSYTECLTRAARWVMWALAAWSVMYGVLSWTNDSHRLVWDTWEVIPEGSFSRLTYVLGPLGWAQTAFSYGLISISLGVILWVYAGTGARARHLSWWIVAGALAPLSLNVVFLFGVGPLEKDFTPIAMALSSAAFAVGLARYRFLDLRPVARAALVDNLQEGVLVLDTNGRVADANAALHRVLGLTIEIGRPLRETAPALAHAIATAPDDTLRLRTGSETRYVDLRVSPLTDGAGLPSGRLILLYDVTRRREERAALHRANADLYQVNTELQARNDELDAFAHTVAHDLKNSVQGIGGWAEVLRDDGPDMTPEEHHEVADDVVQSALKMGEIIHELLLLAGVRQSDVELRPVEMGAVVVAALDRLRPSRVVELMSVPESWPVVVAHAPWVEEIWVNYLSNAAKYGGPAIRLGADCTEVGHARFWVHDDGPGLAPEAQQRLFVPFSRVGSQAVEGHGLGLSIVRRITERLGGTCGVESSPHAGTRFWFAFPLAETVGAEPGSESVAVSA